MAAFLLTTELFNYFRHHAQQMNCNPCFDDKKDEIHAMNETGSNGVPGCLRRENTQCPCKAAMVEIENDGTCYGGIFVRILVKTVEPSNAQSKARSRATRR